VEHDGSDGFIITTNVDGAMNNRLMETKTNTPGRGSWTEIIPYKEERRIDEVSVFKEYIVLEGREGGLTQVWVMSRDDPQSLKKLDFKEELFEVGISANRESHLHRN